jgi:hypothetical protein
MPNPAYFSKFATNSKSTCFEHNNPIKSRIMKLLLRISLVLLIISASTLTKAQYSPAITVADLQKQIGFLASDSLKGRKPGTPEDAVAAAFIRDCFIKAGLKPIADKGFQTFEIVSDVQAGSNNLLKINNEILKQGSDFEPLSFSASSKANGGVAFAGYGFDLNVDSLVWNDYQSLDVKGKWVIVLRGDPEPENSGSRFIPYNQERSKVLTAKDKGAIGVLFVTPLDMDKEDVLMHTQYDKSPSDAGLPVFHVKRAVADKILASMDYTIQGLETSIKEQHKPNSIYLEASIEGVADIVKKRVKTQNVVALLEGSDLALRNEYVVIGAHYDHLGMGGEGSGSRMPDQLAIHNGADDNASGTAGVIELAQKLASMRSTLRRSVVFVAFAGEEMGLLGSKEFVKNPPIDLKKVNAMINMDMIGRMNPSTNTISVGGTGTSEISDTLVTLLSAGRSFKVTHSPDGYGPSDHASFYSENIPVFYFTTGGHDDYHTPADDTDKISFQGEIAVLEMVSDLAVKLSNDNRLQFRESGSKQAVRYGRNMKVTLGIVPDMVSSDNDGLRVDGVRKGGPAEKAGIVKGDKIVSIESQPVTNIYEYMNRLGKLKPGQVATVEIIREGVKQVLIVQF